MRINRFWSLAFEMQLNFLQTCLFLEGFIVRVVLITLAIALPPKQQLCSIISLLTRAHHFFLNHRALRRSCATATEPTGVANTKSVRTHALCRVY